MVVVGHMWNDSGEGVGSFLIRLMLDADPTCMSGCEVVMEYVWFGSDLRRVVILLSGGRSVDGS